MLCGSASYAHTPTMSGPICLWVQGINIWKVIINFLVCSFWESYQHYCNEHAYSLSGIPHPLLLHTMCTLLDYAVHPPVGTPSLPSWKSQWILQWGQLSYPAISQNGSSSCDTFVTLLYHLVDPPASIPLLSCWSTQWILQLWSFCYPAISQNGSSIWDTFVTLLDLSVGLPARVPLLSCWITQWVLQSGHLCYPAGSPNGSSSQDTFCYHVGAHSGSSSWDTFVTLQDQTVHPPAGTPLLPC